MPRCYYHPNVETNLACGKCGRYVCPRCMVQTPVGVRCPECVQLRRLPTFDVRASHYLRAALAGGVLGGGMGAIWGLITPWLNFFWALHYAVVLGIAYLVGEGISLSVNRKRGTGLAVIVAISLALAMGISAVFSGGFSELRTLLGGIFGLVFVGVAFYIAIQRVR
jgi:hypothetical protein